MERFRNKYRNASARAQWWDYGRMGAYFVTICTKNREHFFGKIAHGTMKLSAIGEIAHAEWIKTFDMRPDMNLGMGEFVVMPNHFHGIVIIGRNRYNKPLDRGAAMHCGPATVPTTVQTPDTTDTNEPPNKPGQPKNQFGPQSKNLASIVRGFKIGVTTNARAIDPGFAWQSRFHDHIIRNEAAYQRISRYIKNNPANWQEDTFH